MFSDEILERIFSQPEVQRVPLDAQSIMISAVEKVLQEESQNADEFQSG